MLLKISALYLWYFILVFFLAVVGSNKPLLEEGTVIGDLLIRRPYQWDFELMFTALFTVWGFFLWKASDEPAKHSLFVSFTGLAFLIQGLVMIVLAVLRTSESLHFLLDSVPWFVFGVLLLRYQGKIRV